MSVRELEENESLGLSFRVSCVRIVEVLNCILESREQQCFGIVSMSIYVSLLYNEKCSGSLWLVVI